MSLELSTARDPWISGAVGAELPYNAMNYSGNEIHLSSGENFFCEPISPASQGGLLELPWISFIVGSAGGGICEAENWESPRVDANMDANFDLVVGGIRSWGVSLVGLWESVDFV